MKTDTTPLFLELIALAGEGLSNRQSDADDGVHGAHGDYLRGLAALDRSSVIVEMLSALEELVRVLPPGRFNVRKDFDVLVRHAAATKVIREANEPLLLSGCFDGLRGLEISMTLEQAQSASHAGQCDADVSALVKLPAIAEQLDAMSADDIRDGLRESGAWDAAELADDSANRERAVWLAACDIKENQTR